MSLAAGQSLSFYRILGPLGAGGMGEVYRARDTRLEREVAIKVLPEHFAADDERLHRFEREAKTLASLNHPNVAAIHGIDQEGDVCFLVMELVAGEDLGARLVRGPLSLRETLDVARQIADGLAVAHDSGVVHRDLKPANVGITTDGAVKLLDFGLARTGPRANERPGTPSAAKPDSFFVTEEGLVLGTPTYMSPEQARGHAVDRRTDVWAFGCVVFECLTGSRAFDGPTVADVLAAIMEREPDLERLPRSTPPRLVELLRRCLAKDPRRRLQHLGDARIELEELQANPSSNDTVPVRARSAAALDGGGGTSGASTARLAAVGLATLLLGGALGWFLAFERAASDDAPPQRLTRLSIPIEPEEPNIYPRISPDGRVVVFGGRETRAGATRTSLFLRALDASEPARLPGTEGVETFAFSPDGDALVVVRRRNPGDARFELERVDIGSGPPRSVPLGPYVDKPNLSGGIAWTDAGMLVTTGDHERLLRRAVDGGTWSEVPLVLPAEITGYTPDVFRATPGGRYVLANSFGYSERGFQSQVVAIDVESGVAKSLCEGGHASGLAPGYLLFSSGSTLNAAPFDVDTLQLTGPTRPLLDGLRTSESWRAGWFDVARDGTVVFLPGGRQGTERRLMVAGHGAAPVPWTDDARGFDGMLATARDGSFLVAAVAAGNGLIETWGTETDRPLLRPLLARPATDFLPGPIDEERGLLYATRVTKDGDEGVWRAPLVAPEKLERVWAPEDKRATVFELSPDGNTFFARVVGDGVSELVEVDVDHAGDGEPTVRPSFPIDNQTWGVSVSPRGDWVAYSDAVDGQRSMVLRRLRADGSYGPVFPMPSAESEADGGFSRYWWAEWAIREATEPQALLAYSPGGETIVEIEVTGDDRPNFSAPRAICEISNRELLDYVGLPGDRVLMLVRGEEELIVDRIDVVLGTRALFAR